MTDTSHTPPARSLFFPERVATRVVLTTILIIVLPTSLAVGARWLEPSEWHASNWYGVIADILLGVLFLTLAQLLQHRASRLATATANLQVWDAIGGIARAGARSFGDSASNSLVVPTRALAGMQLIGFAQDDVKTSFFEVLRSAYSSIALNVFIYPQALSIAARNRLVKDSRTLQTQLGEVSKAENSKTLRDQVEELIKHIELCLKLERWWALAHIPDRAATSSAAIGDIDVGDIERLFYDELQVLHDWTALPSRDFQVSARLCSDPRLLGELFAPWYVAKLDTGSWAEVNFEGKVQGTTTLIVPDEVFFAYSPNDHPWVPVSHNGVQL